MEYGGDCQKYLKGFASTEPSFDARHEFELTKDLEIQEAYILKHLKMKRNDTSNLWKHLSIQQLRRFQPNDR